MSVRPQNEVQTQWYGVRTVPMPDDDERGIASVLIWIERRDGGEWAVGRASDLAQRHFSSPRESDYVYAGFDLDEVLQAANEALEDDVNASESDGIDPSVKPFTHSEIEKPLNEWFWGRRAV